MDIYSLANNEGNYNFNTYILYQDGFIKNKRQNFLDKIRTEFNVQDKHINYSRCHSISYSSIVNSIIKIFNLLLKSRNNNDTNLSYDDCKNVTIQYLAGLILAVKKYPLLFSNDYTSISINNTYSKIINSDDIKLSFIEYAISKNLILKLIFRLLNKPNDVDFIDHLLDYGNILVEKLNNCNMNLRVGPAKYNSFVHEYYDLISFQSCDDGIIIDNEMDCCALSHVKNIMYPIETNILKLDTHSIILPDIFLNNNQYEIMTSFQLCDNNQGSLGEKVNNAKVYFYDWYTKDKNMITL